MWSYPIVKDGLIYVVDLRNGLDVLEYNGAFDKGSTDPVPGWQLEPGRRTLLRAGGPGTRVLRLTA
jgi:hypothetical protein